MVFHRENNLTMLVKLNAGVSFGSDFCRHFEGQNQASRIVQKPFPCLGVKPVPLVFEVHPVHAAFPHSIHDYHTRVPSESAQITLGGSGSDRDFRLTCEHVRDHMVGGQVCVAPLPLRRTERADDDWGESWSQRIHRRRPRSVSG